MQLPRRPLIRCTMLGGPIAARVSIDGPLAGSGRSRDGGPYRPGDRARPGPRRPQGGPAAHAGAVIEPGVPGHAGAGVQLLIITLGPAPRSDTGLTRALNDLGRGEQVRLLDFQALRTDPGGHLVLIPPGDVGLPEPPAGGALVDALLGAEGAPDPAPLLAGNGWYWYLADRIPLCTPVLLVLVEHRWADPVARALAARHAVLRYDAWLHPGDLGSTGTAHRR